MIKKYVAVYKVHKYNDIISELRSFFFYLIWPPPAFRKKRQPEVSLQHWQGNFFDKIDWSVMRNMTIGRCLTVICPCKNALSRGYVSP